MKRVFLLALLLAAVAPAADEVPALRIREIPGPTGAGSAASPVVTMSPDGVAWLTWLERDAGHSTLLCATFDAAAERWNPPHAIRRASDLQADPADAPALSVGLAGHAAIVWSERGARDQSADRPGHGEGYIAYISQTRDAGRTWTLPTRLTAESSAVEFPTLTTLADGRVLAAWLDGRAHAAAGGNQQLFARTIGAAGPDVLIDARVCDCCPLSLTAFPDGTALLAYRGRSEAEVRDIRVTRWSARGWEQPRPLHQDGWRITGCPVNGPQVASDGGRVAAAWFTAADSDPRILLSFSSDAGARFLLPLRLSEPKATMGRVSTVLLHDSTVVVSWLDPAGALQARRVTPDFVPAEAVTVTTAAAGRVRGFPRLALLRDYLGGKTSAAILTVFTRENTPGLITVLITVPEGDLLESEKNCDCSPTPDQLQGFPLRGTVVRSGTAGTWRVQHPAIPGIFPAGTQDFRTDAAALAPSATPGRQFLGRIERRDGAWWLFDVRWIATAPAAAP
jgi:hypothetical protein